MNYFVKNLGLDNCIKFKVGNTEILLDSFKHTYNGDFGTDNIILHNKEKYFYMGYIGENNKVAQDILDNGYAIVPLQTYIKELICEKIMSEMFNYIQEVKDKELFNTNEYFYNYSIIGKNPLQEINEQIKFQMYFDKLANDEIIIDNWVQNGISQELKFNISYNKFYINDDIVNEEEERKIIFNRFCSYTMKKRYVLYYRYINNLLKGNDLGYKEIANLVKWVEEKQAKTLTVVYNLNGVEKETKISANIDKVISYLPKDNYKEMIYLWGVNDIQSITQIKGFKYGKDFYKLNTENLVYKKSEV